MQNIYDRIVAHLADHKARVVVATYAQARQYKHAADFKLSGDALYVRRGKHWDCIGRHDVLLVGVRFGTLH